MVREVLIERIIIDDFIGGRKGKELIRKLIQFGHLRNTDMPFGLDEIRKDTIKKLKGKHYDLMVFLETGGVYFLYIPPILAHATKAIILPTSSHKNPKYSDVSEYIFAFQDAIAAARTIAIVEGDVGPTENSYKKLHSVKYAVNEINKKAKIEVIIGVISGKYKTSSLIDIYGTTASFFRLSDIADDIELMHQQTPKSKRKELPPLMQELLAIWHKKKQMQVPIKWK